MMNTASIPHDFQQDTLRDLYYRHPSLIRSGSRAGLPVVLAAASGSEERGRTSADGTNRCSSSSLGAAVPPPPRHVVKHNYHDHAGESEQGISSQGQAFSWSLLAPPFLPVFTSSAGGSISEHYAITRKSPHQQRSRAALRFPERLYDMLQDIEDGEKDLGGIVSWQPHGRCFLVRKPKAFVEQVLSKYFRQSKLTSFQRQLNVYGFSRLTVGRDRGAYYHEFFLRGRRSFCKHIARIQIKGTGIKPAPSPATEPDLYEFRFCHDKVAGPPSRRGVLQRHNENGSGRTLEARLTTPSDVLLGESSFACSQVHLDPVDVLSFHASSPVLMFSGNGQPPGALWLSSTHVDDASTPNETVSPKPAFLDLEMEPTPLAEDSSLQFLVSNSKNSNVKEEDLEAKKSHTKKEDRATDAFIKECHTQIDSILFNIFAQCASSETL